MNKLKIDVLANDGSPIGVTEQSIHGLDGRLGVGGAELAILTLCRGWHDAGHDVTFYNNPQVHHGSVFRQKPISLFHPKEQRDILIIFRSPNTRIRNAEGKKIWFSTDQYTVGNFKDFATEVDEIVTISPFHAKYFRDVYGINRTTTIDLPVRLWEYQGFDGLVEKKKNSLIFCSVPDRGLQVLAGVYDKIVSHIPDVSLTITSDYRLWGNPSPLNGNHVKQFHNKPGVRFLGAVSRDTLVLEQLRADIQAYPCTYDELFCYAVAECQVAGAYPITSSTGALNTTNLGTIVDGDIYSKEWKDEFVETIVKQLGNRKFLNENRQSVQRRAIERFSLEKILKQWDKVFYE